MTFYNIFPSRNLPLYNDIALREIALSLNPTVVIYEPELLLSNDYRSRFREVEREIMRETYHIEYGTGYYITLAVYYQHTREEVPK